MKAENIGEYASQLERALPGTIAGTKWNSHRGWVIAMVEVDSGHTVCEIASIAEARRVIREAKR